MKILYKQSLVEAIAFLFILLFVYTATDKLMHQLKFEFAISQFPVIGNFSPWLSGLIPALEILVSLVLIIPGTRRAGLAGTFVLMLGFTVFTALMLLMAEKLPCSCGGMISELTWRQHLVLNLVLLILAGAGLRLYNKNKDFIAINRISRKPV